MSARDVNRWIARAMRIAIVAVLPIAGVLAADLSAGPEANDPPFLFLQVTVRVMQPGQDAVVADYYTKLRSAEARFGIDGLTDVYVVADGGQVPTFVTVRPFKAWHDLDEDAETRSLATLTRAYGAQEARRLSAALSAASASVATEVDRVLGGLNNWYPSPSRKPWPYMRVRRTTIKPGMERQHLALVRELRDARRRANAVAEVRWQVVDGEGGTFGAARFFRGWQDRNLWEGELAAAIGDEGAARWTAAMSATVERTSTVVLRRRPELSRGAPHALTND
ncbi:MAG: hypothetical protein R2745_16880 [Vicinamibacterales bacterium]